MTPTIKRIVGTHHHASEAISDLTETVTTLVTGSGGVPGLAASEVLFDASGMTDGSATSFETPDYFSEDSSRVFLNGLLQRPIVDYTERSAGGDMFDAITLTAAPVSGDELLIEYEVVES